MGKYAYMIGSFKLDVTRDNVQMPIDEFSSEFRVYLVEQLCSSIDERERIFTGFSTVRFINRYFDSNCMFLMEISFDIRDCS